MSRLKCEKEEGGASQVFDNSTLILLQYYYNNIKGPMELLPLLMQNYELCPL
jgi:hypothetical protein